MERICKKEKRHIGERGNVHKSVSVSKPAFEKNIVSSFFIVDAQLTGSYE